MFSRDDRGSLSEYVPTSRPGEIAEMVLETGRDVTQPDLYDPHFVAHLFDEMARTYGTVNLISSLGFARRWRKQCLDSIAVAPGDSVVDLMTGMGELCPDLLRLTGRSGAVLAMDISAEMCRRASRHGSSVSGDHFHVIQADALNIPLEDQSVDCVVSTFGLKTFNELQRQRLASEVKRVLKPGGQFSFMEISVPASPLLRRPYLTYLRRVIPLIGRLLLGNPENYRLLGVYTVAFQNCGAVAADFAAVGLQVQQQSRFFGCATGIRGSRPADHS